MRLNLPAKIIIAIQFAFCFALLSTIGLNYLKMDKVVASAVASRFQVVVTGLAKEVEGAINLGLSMTSLPGLDALVERERARDDRIASIVLFDDLGKVVFTSGIAEPKPTVPESWRKAFFRDGADGQSSTSFAEGGEQVIGATIHNAFGRPAGGVALTYSLAELHAGVRGTLPGLLLTGALILAVGLAVIALAVWLLVRPMQRQLQRWTEALNAADTDEPVPPPKGGEADAAELGLGIDRFLDKAHEIRTMARQPKAAALHEEMSQ